MCLHVHSDPGRPAAPGLVRYASMPASFSNVLLPSPSPLRLTQPIVAARPASHEDIAATQQRESLRAARDLLEAREALENRRRSVQAALAEQQEPSLQQTRPSQKSPVPRPNLLPAAIFDAIESAVVNAVRADAIRQRAQSQQRQQQQQGVDDEESLSAEALALLMSTFDGLGHARARELVEAGTDALVSGLILAFSTGRSASVSAEARERARDEVAAMLKHQSGSGVEGATALKLNAARVSLSTLASLAVVHARARRVHDHHETLPEKRHTNVEALTSSYRSRAATVAEDSSKDGLEGAIRTAIAASGVVPHARADARAFLATGDAQGFLARDESAEGAPAHRQSRLLHSLRAGGRPRQLVGLSSAHETIKGLKWDDAELTLLARMLERRDLPALLTLEVGRPNDCGGVGLRALSRAFLVGAAPELRELKLHVERAVDEDLLMLAAALNARLGGGASAADAAAEAPAAASSRNAGPAASSPVQDAGGGATTGPPKLLGQPPARFLAAPKLWKLVVTGGSQSTALSSRALANVARARLQLAPPSRASADGDASAASAARVPLQLVQFRKALSDLEGGGGVQRSGRSAAAPVTAAAMRAEEEELRRRRREVFRSWDGSGSGRLSLAEVGSGISQALSASYAQEGAVLYHRYYRSFIRAFEDTKRPGDDFVTPDRFARLLANLRQYATCLEVFLLVDRQGRRGSSEGDHRLSKSEWADAVAGVRAAGHAWAPFSAFRGAAASDFDFMDRDKRGHVTLAEFVAWVNAAEAVAAEAQGAREMALSRAAAGATASAARRRRSRTRTAVVGRSESRARGEHYGSSHGQGHQALL